MADDKKKPRSLHLMLLLLTVIAYTLSAINPFNRLAWLGQATPGILLVLLLAATYRRFRFTTFVYVLVLLHMLLVFYGAHYTYSRNPLFHYLQEQFDWQRNYFDRVGHFAQGFVPAFLLKEFLVQSQHVKRGKFLLVLVILSCLGLSAAYELGEFALVKILDIPADQVMGTQGDFFDSQWDMLWALIGAAVATVVFGPLHDKQLERRWEAGERGEE